MAKKGSTATPNSGAAPSGEKKAKKKAVQRTAIEHAERALRRQLTDLGDGAAVNVRDGLEGVIRLLQTVDQIVDPSAPPATGSAWEKVVGLGRQRRLMGQVFAPKPAAPAAPAGGNGQAATPPAATAPTAPPNPQGSQVPVGAGAGAQGGML